MDKPQPHGHSGSIPIEEGDLCNLRSRLAFALALTTALVLASSSLAPRVYAYDSTCSPNLTKWYGIFIHDTPNAPMAGAHASNEKVPMTAGTSQYLGVNMWTYTTSSLNWWAEIDYGVNAHYVHGPAWNYYYFNGSGDHWGDDLPFDASADYTMHDVTIKDIGSGQWYGYIDGQVAMLASGIGDGVYRQDVGIESDSCHDQMAVTNSDSLTSEYWDGSWTPWISGSEQFDSPVSGGWTSQPTSGNGWEN